jgi:hypothetical protein
MFHPKIGLLRDNAKKTYGRTKQAKNDNMAHAPYMLDN